MIANLVKLAAQHPSVRLEVFWIFVGLVLTGGSVYLTVVSWFSVFSIVNLILSALCFGSFVAVIRVLHIDYSYWSVYNV